MVMRRLTNQGDSLIRTGSGKPEQDAAQRPEANPGVAKRRSEALRSFFPKLSVWLNNRIHFARMREIESYLSQATDLADLEHRIAKIERSARWH